jgi:hypothetical protein
MGNIAFTSKGKKYAFEKSCKELRYNMMAHPPIYPILRIEMATR